MRTFDNCKYNHFTQAVVKCIILSVFVVCVSACSQERIIESMAIRYVKSTYADCDKIILCSIDSITYGDNLEYRIHTYEQRLERFHREYDSYNNSSFDKKWKEEHMKQALEKIANVEKALTSLDSLKQVSGELLNHITAYECCVTYNRPGNIVFVQMDEFGNLLNITKDSMKRLLNPGNDIPGYYEISKAESEALINMAKQLLE